MTLQTLIFGAIGTLAETSDIQRQAFNLAFKDVDLNWDWDLKTYRKLLEVNGGQNRIRHYAQLHNTALSDDAIRNLHTSKTNHYEAILQDGSLPARPGIVNLIQDAASVGIRIGLASTTSPQNIDAMFKALSDVKKSDFDFILSGEDVSAPKPSPEIYESAARQSETLTSQIIVIEDSPVSALAAKRAGLMTVIYPGETVAHQDMSGADAIVSAKDINIAYFNTLLLNQT